MKPRHWISTWACWVGAAFVPAAAQMPTDFPGLQIWFAADAGLTLYNGDQLVGNWADQSGNGNHAYTEFGSLFLMPTYVPDALNGFGALRFDGNTDYLLFPERTDVRTVFWVAKEDLDAGSSVQRCLLGHSTQYNFLRGPGQTIWHPLVTEHVLNGVTRLNFAEVNGTSAVLPQDYFVMSIVTAGNTSASAITLDRNISSNIWKGDFMELIVYNQPLDQSQVEAIENYLADKYTPAFTPLDDVVVEYGFCDTTLCAPDGFVSYVWNGNTGGQCIDVNSSGDYVLEVVDRFGRSHSDTVQVTFPGSIESGTFTFCDYEGYTWDTGLNDNDYTFAWSSGGSAPSEFFNVAEEVSVLITDSTGCAFEASRTLIEDAFSTLATFGPDLSLCAGNTIEPDVAGYEIASVEWNTGATIIPLPVFESGIYWIHATDNNGCEAADTIVIDITGVAPTLTIAAGTACEDVTVSFLGDAEDASSIVTWQWTIDGTGIGGQNAEYTFQNAGEFDVLLTALNDQGCTGVATYTALVHPPPLASFVFEAACNNALSEFIQTAVPADAPIANYNWDIASQVLSGSVVSAVIDNAGFNAVSLEVIDEFGCRDTTEIEVWINAAPVTDFTFSGICEGSLTFFEEAVDDSESGPITGYQWLFGDGIGSLSSDPSHYYPDPDIYDVQLIATATTGCKDTLMKEVEILAEPVVDFLLANGCVGQVYQMQDFSEAPGDDIISWMWTFDGGVPVEEHEPEYVFNTTGLHDVKLQIQTAAGCEAEVTQMIPVWPVPIPAFVFSPEIGSPPLAVHFTNLSEQAVEYDWNFGDGTESDEVHPLHTYQDTGAYVITLEATSAQGCTAEIQDDILVDEPVLDLMVLDFALSVEDQLNGLSALIYNNGNFTVYEIYFRWRKGNASWVTERWQGALAPGQTMEYAYQSYFTINPIDFEFLCTRADGIVEGTNERTPSNNELCHPTDEEVFSIFPPYTANTASGTTIEFVTPGSGPCIVEVFDATGRRMWETTGDVGPGFVRFEVASTNWKSGVYIVNIMHGAHGGTAKWIKIP
ncbi:MAG: PKD domain-containing protein [Flavobacteriales bacterium]|nr:PKD domain-containing protein [Flavobacteriales bacterium]